MSYTDLNKLEYKKAVLAAQYLIYKNSIDKKGLTNKKLQKLLYYSQAWSLVMKNKPLFESEIQAWVHGPAVPEVYFLYRKFGFQEIKEKINLDLVKSGLTEDDREILDIVWDAYGNYDGDTLEIITHSERPWINARKNLEQFVASEETISLEEMKDFYEKRYQEAQAKNK